MLKRFALAAAALAVSGAAHAADTVKIGIIGPFSGPFAIYGQQFQRGAELYLEEIGGKAGDTRIELVFRDDSQGPEKAKQVAQELIVRERVKMLGGIVFTPNALSIAPLATEAKTPLVVFNAATGMITRKSPYIARVSHTQWQGAYTVAQWAAKNGVDEAYVVVSDNAPGQDARDAFKEGFTKAGGRVTGELLLPMGTTDFAPFLQRIKDSKPKAVYVFTPVGPMSVGFMKTYAALGLKDAGVRLLATGDTDEMELPAIGDAALDVITAYHYSPHLKTPENERFVAAFKKKYGADAIPNFAAVAAYDGMHAMADVVAKLGAKIDGEKAMGVLKGWKAASPRGPIAIDAEERDIVQNIYIRKVERVGNGLGNIAFDTVPAIGDPWKVANR